MTTAGPRQAIIAPKLLSCGAPERSGAYGEWLRVPQSDAQRGRLGSTAVIDSSMATACSMPLRTPMPPFSFRPTSAVWSTAVKDRFVSGAAEAQSDTNLPLLQVGCPNADRPLPARPSRPGRHGVCPLWVGSGCSRCRPVTALRVAGRHSNWPTTTMRFRLRCPTAAWLAGSHPWATQPESA
jgi:hypothetical protein